MGLAYLLWSLPVIGVAALIASGRASSARAGFCGLIATIAVALASAPGPFGPADAVIGTLRGAWLALLIGAVILGGLFFREILSPTEAASDPVPVPAARRRRELYAACFLVGPFAEAATGFGVGQVTIAPLLRRIRLAPVDAVILGLFSQMMVPWGALANGTILGAQLSGLSPTVLGHHSALLTLPLLMAWLGLFWHFAAAAGVPGTWRDRIAEAVSTAAAGALLILANRELGPEVAAMAALGPLIAARFLIGAPSGRDPWRAALRVGLPYAALILGLAATRAILPLNQILGHAIILRPFADGPAWLPLLHPGSWLLAVGVATAFGIGRWRSVPQALRGAWRRGRMPILAIVLFLAMAQVTVASGIAGGVAEGLRASLGAGAAWATPLLAALFGFLTSSGSATNGLLMPAQAALAQATQLSLPWLAAVQNVAAAAATMLCPVRLAMGCALVGRPELERAVYRRAWPLGAVPLVVLLAFVACLLL